MNLGTVFADILYRNAERRIDSAEEERALIAAAKLGDNEATVALMYAYAPAIRSAVAAFHVDDVEELHSLILLGVVEAIAAFDPAKSARLAAVVRHALIQTLREEYGAPAFHVPPRTLTRFYSILRKAEGNVEAALALASEHEMTPETFLAVLDAVRNVDSYEALTADAAEELPASPLWDSAEEEEDALLVAAAFEAVDELEEGVCRLSYGFETGDPVTDTEVGRKFDLSRQKAQRVRSGALDKMRVALAVIDEAPVVEEAKAAPFRLSTPDRIAIAKRDGWTCQICHKPINPSAVSGLDPDALEIDHIIPQSEFRPGEEALRDHPSNLRATHRACNNAKSGGARQKTDDAVKRLDLIPTVTRKAL